MDAFSIDADTRLGPVHLRVSDLQVAIPFYRDVLGLTLLDASGDQAILGTGGTPLISLREQRGARRKPPRTTGLYHYAILLPSRGDLARELRQLVESRYALEGASDHGVSEALYLADPDGNGIEIYADRPKEEWPRAADGSIGMATNPLNVESLMAELEPNGWGRGGMPAGTRIGHVHLHVADLARAEAFYHGVLGFDLITRYGHQAAFLSAGGYHHHIGLNTWAGVGAPEPPEDAVGLDYFTVYLPRPSELDEEARRIGDAGMVVEEREGGLMARDPSGNSLLLAVEPAAVAGR